MKGKPSPSLQANNQPSQIKKLAPLSAIFRDQQLLGWQIIDMESCLYSEMNISIETITLLTSLYMKIIEKLNTIQDPREHYFSLKMQKLMAEPYVIRCFNSNTQDNKKNVLESRKKQLQQKLEKEVERHNHRRVLQQVIIAQEQKEQKMKNKVKEIIQQSNRNLQERIKRRNQIKQMRNSMLSASQLVASEAFTGLDSPKFASNRSRHNLKHSRVQSSSSFQLMLNQGEYFHALKREIDAEQQEERMEQRLRMHGPNNARSK